MSSHLDALLSNLNPKGVASSLIIWIDAAELRDNA